MFCQCKSRYKGFVKISISTFFIRSNLLQFNKTELHQPVPGRSDTWSRCLWYGVLVIRRVLRVGGDRTRIVFQYHSSNTLTTHHIHKTCFIVRAARSTAVQIEIKYRTHYASVLLCSGKQLEVLVTPHSKNPRRKSL